MRFGFCSRQHSHSVFTFEFPCFHIHIHTFVCNMSFDLLYTKQRCTYDFNSLSLQCLTKRDCTIVNECVHACFVVCACAWENHFFPFQLKFPPFNVSLGLFVCRRDVFLTTPQQIVYVFVGVLVYRTNTHTVCHGKYAWG